MLTRNNTHVYVSKMKIWKYAYTWQYTCSQPSPMSMHSFVFKLGTGVLWLVTSPDQGAACCYCLRTNAACCYCLCVRMQRVVIVCVYKCSVLLLSVCTNAACCYCLCKRMQRVVIVCVRMQRVVIVCVRMQRVVIVCVRMQRVVIVCV